MYRIYFLRKLSNHIWNSHPLLKGNIYFHKLTQIMAQQDPYELIQIYDWNVLMNVLNRMAYFLVLIGYIKGTSNLCLFLSTFVLLIGYKMSKSSMPEVKFF